MHDLSVGLMNYSMFPSQRGGRSVKLPGQISAAEHQPDVVASLGSMSVAADRGGVEIIERWADDWRNLCNECMLLYRPMLLQGPRALLPRRRF